MANTMLSNGSQTLKTADFKASFEQFKKNIEQSGKDPKTLLDEAMKSGKYSQVDLNRAKQMANMFAKFLK